MLTAPDYTQKQIIFALLSHGEKLSFKNDNIVIKNKDGKIRYQSTCYRLFALFVVGHISITSGLLQRAKKFGFSLHLLTHGLHHYGSWQCKTEGNILLRQKQYAYQGLDIAIHLVDNKIQQQIVTLQHRRQKNDELKHNIQLLKQYHASLPDKATDLYHLLGIEGIASRVYFTQMFADYNWQGRKPRVKHDITNLLLDIGYTLLFNIIDNLLNLYGFDVYQGVYHQTFYQRKSLVCDLVEPFRPIVDQCIYKAWRLKQINPDDFTLVKHQYRLYGQNSKPYTELILKALLKHKQAMFIYIQSYYRAFMRDKPINEYPVFKIKDE